MPAGIMFNEVNMQLKFIINILFCLTITSKNTTLSNETLGNEWNI